MSPEALATWTLVLTVFGAMIVWFFRSPKEVHNSLAARVTQLENAHQTLALRFEGSHARHDESLENLTESIDRLTQKIDRIESLMVGKGHAGRR